MHKLLNTSGHSIFTHSRSKRPPRKILSSKEFKSAQILYPDVWVLSKQGGNVYNKNMNRKNTKLKKINLISTLIFVLVAIFYLVQEKSTHSKQSARDVFVSVVSVSDGDTVSVMIDRREEKVRLIGIDAPELGQKPWGGEARKYLESILSSSGWKVKLEYDVEKKDKYGRILAYLRATDGRLINLLMVEGGYAMLYTFPPNVKYVNDLRAAQAEAREKRLGIWSDKGMKEKPKDYRKKHPRI